MNDVLSTEELKEITGYQRPSDVERCLETQGISFFHGKNGPWTTLDLINAAKGLSALSRPQSGDIL